MPLPCCCSSAGTRSRIARNPVFAPFTAGELTPGDAVADDDVQAQVIAANPAVYGHPTSTAPMGGPGDPWAVVDSVSAVKGLSAEPGRA